MLSKVQSVDLRMCCNTVSWEIFVVNKCSYSSKIAKIKHAKYFRHTYYGIRWELNYHGVWKKILTRIFYGRIFFNMKKFPKLRYTVYTTYMNVERATKYSGNNGRIPVLFEYRWTLTFANTDSDHTVNWEIFIVSVFCSCQKSQN